MNGVRTLGVILAGGAGMRVGGADKGLVTLHGEPVVERVAALLRPQCDDVLIVANRHPAEYARYARVVGDEMPGFTGPLSGIAAALAQVFESGQPGWGDCQWLLTVPVDCPDFPPDLFARLHAAFASDPQLACAYARDAHKVQPLFALYTLQHGERLLESARVAAHVHGSPLRWHLELRAREVDFHDETAAFHNLNSLKDFRDYERTHPAVAGPVPPTSTPAAPVDAPSVPPSAAPAYPMRISLEEALEIVATHAAEHRLPIETVTLAQAHGLVLAGDVVAPHALPPFANSAMDGFALHGADLPAAGERALAVVGSVFAGDSALPIVGPGQCARITTGAPIPPGADTVVVKENVTVVGERVLVRVGERPGSNIRKAGEDYALGEVALAAGTRMTASQLGVAAALGVTHVDAWRRPRVAIIATGSELVPAGQPLGFGQIHESNGVMLAALAQELGAEVVSCVSVRDEPDALGKALLEAAAVADIVVSSGGVSAGEADHLPGLLRKVGEIAFHKMRFKPGMPVLFGQIGACLYFGLPGNPVASAVTFRVLVRFALRAVAGAADVPTPQCARLTAPHDKQHERAELARCTVATDSHGVLWATLHRRQGSHLLRSLAETTALALLPAGKKRYAPGDVVVLWPET